MTDFLHNLIHSLPNAVTTVIMGVLLLYWLFVFVSGAGLEGLDIDLDLDTDVDIPDSDIDTDSDSDTDVDTEKAPGFFMRFLNFLNVGKVPFMLVLSTFKFFLWIGSLITTQFIEVTSWGVWSLLILIPIGFVGIFLTRFATNPLVKLFKEIGYKGEEEIDFLGRSGRMLSNIKDKKIGCAEFVIDKNPIKLNVMSIDGSELRYGEYVLVADESEDKKIYLVSKEISMRNL
ncbi:MAG: YqiJ family protein [Prevotella sp.]|nr:YqiJ family protein [Prevotella sp.]